jgi:4-carboxymuconolactone decarboxylase
MRQDKITGHRSAARQSGHGALPWLSPSSLDALQHRVYDAIVGGARNNAQRAMPLTDKDGHLEGPFNAMLFSPAVGLALQALGGALRYEGVLSGRLRELAVLEVARLRRSTFEWMAHMPLARTAGLTADDVAAVQTGRDSEGFTQTDELVRELTRDLLLRHDLRDDQIEAAQRTLGVEGACELVFLVGYYDILALSLRVWRTPLPQGVTPPQL